MSDLLIGVGNPVRGDDGVGCFVAEQASKAAPNLDVLISRGDPAELLDAWGGKRKVVIVDACVSGATPGTLHRFDACAGPLPSVFGEVSTHGVDLGASVEMARALDGLPSELIIYGIEAVQAAHGTPITPRVLEAAQSLSQRILEEFTPQVEG